MAPQRIIRILYPWESKFTGEGKMGIGIYPQFLQQSLVRVWLKWSSWVFRNFIFPVTKHGLELLLFQVGCFSLLAFFGCNIYFLTVKNVFIFEKLHFKSISGRCAYGGCPLKPRRRIEIVNMCEDGCWISTVEWDRLNYLGRCQVLFEGIYEISLEKFLFEVGRFLMFSFILAKT